MGCLRLGLGCWQHSMGCAPACVLSAGMFAGPPHRPVPPGSGGVAPEVGGWPAGARGGLQGARQGGRTAPAGGLAPCLACHAPTRFTQPRLRRTAWASVERWLTWCCGLWPASSHTSLTARPTTGRWLRAPRTCSVQLLTAASSHVGQARPACAARPVLTTPPCIDPPHCCLQGAARGGRGGGARARGAAGRGGCLEGAARRGGAGGEPPAGRAPHAPGAPQGCHLRHLHPAAVCLPGAARRRWR